MSFGGGIGGAVVATARVLLHVDDSQVGPALQKNRAETERAVGGMRTQLSKLEESQLKVKLAQEKYNAAVGRFGAESAQARTALLRLSQAQREVGNTTETSGRKFSLFRRHVNDTERDVGHLSRGLLAGSGIFSHFGRSIAFASGGFLGGVGFMAVIKSAIGAASNLHEQINKVNVVFGAKNAAIIRDWSKTTADSLGIARDSALEFAGTFGALLRPLGLTETAAATMSTHLVKLGADLASFYNRSPEQALEALRSGLVGMPRPLRQFGILLSEDRVKAEALSSGLVKASVDMKKVKLAQDSVAIATAKLTEARRKWGAGTTQVKAAEDSLVRAQMALHKAIGGHVDKLSDAVKVQARFNLMMRDAALANGDFKRTSGGLENQLRILHAQTRNLTEQLGTALMPTVLKLVKQLNHWITHAEKTGELQRDLNKAVSTGTTLVNFFWGAIKALHTILGPVVRLLGGLKDVLKLIGGLWAISKVNAWWTAVRTAGNESAIASGKVSKLGSGLRSLPARVFIQVFIVEEIIKKLTGGGIQDSVAADVHGRAKSPFARGTEMDDFWQAGYNGIGFNAAAKKEGVDPKHADPADREAWQKGVNSRKKLAANGGGKLPPKFSSGIAAATGALGTPYQWGGGGEGGPSFGSRAHGSHNLGYDCSGLAIYVLAHAGVHGLPRTSQGLYTSSKGKPVSGGHLQPLDLVFYHGPHPSHVAVYMGNGWIIQAPHTGDVVKWSKVNEPGAPIGYRRFLPTVKTGGGATPTPDPTIPIPDPTGDDGNGGGGGGNLHVGHHTKKKHKVGHLLSNLIPPELKAQHKLADAKGDFDKAVKVDDLIIDYLKKKIGRTKDVNKRLKLHNALIEAQTQLQIDKLKALKSLDAARAKAIDAETKGMKKEISDEKDKIGKLSSPYTVKDVKDKDGNVIGHTLEGSKETVQFDPNTGQYTTVKIGPDQQALKTELDWILKTKLPEIDAKIKAVKDAIKKYGRNRKRNAKTLASLKKKLTELQDDRQGWMDLAGDLGTSIDEMDDAMKLDPTDTSTGKADDTVPSEPTSTAADTTPATPAETPQIDVPANIAAYLAGRQDLVTGYASNVLAAAFAGKLGLNIPGQAGGAMVINNYFASGPADTHLFSKQLQFELQALGR